MDWYTHAEQPCYSHSVEVEEHFEVDDELISQLPKYRGAIGEDPIPYLHDFDLFCIAMKPIRVDMDDFKFAMLPYSLTNSASVWLSTLPTVNRYAFRIWGVMERTFLLTYSLEVQFEFFCKMVTSSKQRQGESTYEYLQRFLCLLELWPNHGIQDSTLIVSFLDGMNSCERRVMDNMAGGSIMDCYPEDVWDFINRRAADTNPYESSESTYNEHKEDTIESVPQQECSVQNTNDKQAKLPDPEQEPPTASNVHDKPSEPKELSPPLTPQAASDNGMVLPSSNQESIEEENKEEEEIEQEEDMTDEALQVVSSTCNEDINAEPNDFISPQCLDTTLETSIVSLGTPNMSYDSNILLSFHIQDCILEQALGSNKVWGSFDKVDIQIPVAKACKQLSNYRRLFNKVPMNLKSRRKAKCTKRGKEGSSLFLQGQQRHSIFGWKPGWESWRSTSAGKTKGRRCKKFDGVRPWAPNI